MKDLRSLNEHRETVAELMLYGVVGGATEGIFTLPSPIDRAPLKVIASCGDGWEHVSVSRAKRCPNWPEMEFVKRLFFHEQECAMQLHVPVAEHISFHPHCLHIWRPIGVEIPVPPGWMVGPASTPEASHD